MALLKRVLLFCLSIVFIIFYLIGATSSYAKELTSAEEILKDFIEYHSHNDGQLWDTYYETNLGWTFYTDVKYRNFELAYKFTKKAAEGKEPYAINNLALMYEEGYSVKKDLNKAFELYLITLDYENPPWYTDSNIGTFFMLGKGNVEPSYERAVEHFTKAKKNGGEDADKSVLYLEFLEEHKRVPDNYMELAFWLEEKAKDNAEVFIVLGWLLDDYNKKSAYEWYYLASLLAPTKAQMRATQITALLESEILETKDYMDARERAFAWLGRNMESNVKVSPTSCSS